MFGNCRHLIEKKNQRIFAPYQKHVSQISIFTFHFQAFGTEKYWVFIIQAIQFYQNTILSIWTCVGNILLFQVCVSRFMLYIWPNQPKRKLGTSRNDQAEVRWRQIKLRNKKNRVLSTKKNCKERNSEEFIFPRMILMTSS